MIKSTVVGPRVAAAAAAMIKTPAPGAFQLTIMKLSEDGSNSSAMTGVMRIQEASRWVIAIVIMINCDPNIDDTTF